MYYLKKKNHKKNLINILFLKIKPKFKIQNNKKYLVKII